ncbi:hypothetical protein GOV12_07735 [Candidatus Pacearchaeota archaeon]|nr:hypothetical protein [Candidatus Pacearchaeota archaeon]
MSVKKEPNKNKNSLPIPVYLITIIIFLIAGSFMISFFIGIYETSNSNLEDLIMQEDPKKAEEFKLRFENRGIEYNETTLRYLMIFGTIFILAISIFSFILGYSFLCQKNWARITIITFSFISAAMSLIALLFGNLWSSWNVLISLIIPIYLLKSKRVKDIFIKNKEK